MGPHGAAPWPGRRFFQTLLLLAALDSFACGLWALARPDDLFTFLRVPPRDDRWMGQLLQPTDELIPPAADPEHPRRDAGLWHLLGLFALANGGFLGLAAWGPRRYGGLALVPLIGHALGYGLWLWALGAVGTFPARRTPFPDPARLVVLAVHDAVWVAALAAFLLEWRTAGRAGTEPAAGVQ
jgi:hypothetical protein